jgi:hypothetical protein
VEVIARIESHCFLPVFSKIVYITARKKRGMNCLMLPEIFITRSISKQAERSIYGHNRGDYPCRTPRSVGRIC